VVDDSGQAWVARLDNGTVDVVSPDGGLLASYPLGGWVTNLAWQEGRLYATMVDRHAIYRFDVAPFAQR
jgi:hypothetical protein